MKFLPQLLFCICLGICSENIFAQRQFGIAALGIASKPVGDNDPMPGIGGLRGEILTTKCGIDRFRLSYVGLSATYFPTTSYAVTLNRTTLIGASGSTIEGTIKQSELNSILKFGFEIPQHWNDFLFLNVGLGVGIFNTKIQYIIPDYDPNIYRIEGLPRDGSLKENGRGYATSIFFSAYYEFEKFYLFFQLEGLDELPINTAKRDDYIFAAGIYYSFIKRD